MQQIFFNFLKFLVLRLILQVLLSKITLFDTFFRLMKMINGFDSFLTDKAGFL